ncbi:MAG: hypothetical protein ABTD50_13775 [Polyangiaceae bacterium]|jgi:hypothetical protein
MSRRLEALVREAREHCGTREVERIDWDAVGRSLATRVERELRAAVVRPRRVRKFEWEAFAATIALALVVVVLLGKSESRPNAERGGAAPTAAVGAVTDIDGEVWVGGLRASQGTPIRVGDLIDAQAGAVMVARPGHVAFVVERGSRTRLMRGSESTVLALDYGAVEASVEPVASGEAFAVDVGVSRVAAHGTHVRVARIGETVVVDLSDGVVSVGRAPRSGAVEGVLVNAPAHAEFIVASAPETFVVTHVRAAVRPPVSVIPGAFGRMIPVPVAPALVEPEVIDAPPASVPPASARPGLVRPIPRSPMAPPATASAEPLTTSASLATAIRNCLKEQPHADNVTVAFESTLCLQVGDDGTVRSARFDPPVAPDVNACAAPLIYSAHFDGGGAMTVPIDFKN